MFNGQFGERVLNTEGFLFAFFLGMLARSLSPSLPLSLPCSILIPQLSLVAELQVYLTRDLSRTQG